MDCCVLVRVVPDAPSLLNSNAGVKTFMTSPLRNLLQYIKDSVD
jgi:hypothetical protein